MRFRKVLGLVVIALFLLATAGAASAAELDLPKWVIVPEDSSFSDVTLFCPLDAMDVTNNVTPCYYQGSLVNATITFNESTEYPKLVQGRIGNAFELDGKGTMLEIDNVAPPHNVSISIATWIMLKTGGSLHQYIVHHNWNYAGGFNIRRRGKKIHFGVSGNLVESSKDLELYKWYFVVGVYDYSKGEATLYIYDENGNLYDKVTANVGQVDIRSDKTWVRIGGSATEDHYFAVDEVRIYYGKVLSEDELKVLLAAGRKKLSEPTSFRQIFSPMIDLTRDRATFYAGLEVSTSDPSGYVPVPESAVNMSITSAEKLKSDYTNADFYYQGHYWYRADKIQFNLPIQFETVREKGSFDKVIVLDEDQKTYVYEKEFKVTNPTGARLNVVYSLDPTALGFSVLQYPQFELDGIRMVSWQPQNSTDLKLIRTDTLEPGEISTHWIKSIWTLSKEELEFPAKLEDFRNILDWQTAQKLAENAAKGKGDTYVKVIKVSSNADVSNVTIYVPLKGVEDVDDVVEAVALTGSRATLQVEELDDGTIAVKVPSDAFVSGEAEIKVFYNKETSWWKSILDKIMSLTKMIKSFFGFGGG